MAKKKHYWKVLAVQGRDLVSCWMSYMHCNNLVVKYAKNKWAKPPIGKLLIFKTYDDAAAFNMNMYGRFVIRKCEARGVTRPKFTQLTACLDGDIKDLKAFWRGVIHNKRKSNAGWPTGTLCADAVKIIE